MANNSCHILAVAESEFANGSYAISNGYAFKSCTAVEFIFSNFVYIVSYDDAFECSFTLERISFI